MIKRGMEMTRKFEVRKGEVTQETRKGEEGEASITGERRRGERRGNELTIFTHEKK